MSPPDVPFIRLLGKNYDFCGKSTFDPLAVVAFIHTQQQQRNMVFGGFIQQNGGNFILFEQLLTL